MCTITKKSDLKEFTGYKVVVTDKYGHHYSPYTGIRYKKGPVPHLPKKMSKYSVINEYDYRMYGEAGWARNQLQSEKQLTAVYEFINDAEELKSQDFTSGYIYEYTLPNDCEYNIVKMTISGEMYKGKFGGPIILGNVINSIKLVK